MKKIHTLFLAGAALFFFSCTRQPKSQTSQTPVAVSTYYPSRHVGGSPTVSGTVTARQTAMVSTRLMGTIERVYVREGDHVKQGQILVTVNGTDLQAKAAQASAMITEAEAASKDAERDFLRYKNLHALKSVSDKELESMALRNASAKARLKAARQGLSEVRSMMVYAQVRAPFNGVVTQRLVDEGSIANPGMPLIAVEQTGELNVTASVPEEYVASVHKGDPVGIDVGAIGTSLRGTVSELSPSSTMTGGQYLMKVSLREGDRSRLRAGMYATIRLAGKASNDNAQVSVRRSSVVERGQLTGVYVVGSDNKAVLHWVRLGKEAGEHVEVLSGLQTTDRVIDQPGANIYNGQLIKLTD